MKRSYVKLLDRVPVASLFSFCVQWTAKAAVHGFFSFLKIHVGKSRKQKKERVKKQKKDLWPGGGEMPNRGFFLS